MLHIILALALATPAAASTYAAALVTSDLLEAPQTPMSRRRTSGKSDPCLFSPTDLEDSLQVQLYSRFFDTECLADPYVGWCYHLAYECPNDWLPVPSVRDTPPALDAAHARRSIVPHLPRTPLSTACCPSPLTADTAHPLGRPQDPSFIYGPDGVNDTFPWGGCPHPSNLSALNGSAVRCLSQTASGAPYAWGTNCPLHNMTEQMDSFAHGFHLEAQMMSIPIFIMHVGFVQIGGIPSPVGVLGKTLWFLWMVRAAHATRRARHTHTPRHHICSERAAADTSPSLRYALVHSSDSSDSLSRRFARCSSLPSCSTRCRPSCAIA